MEKQKKTAFDAAAKKYDEVFTHSVIGRKQREQVYYWLNKVKLFNKKHHVFELNCGTGYDAEQFHKKGQSVIATDCSEEMIKLAKTRRNEGIQFYRRCFESISEDENIKRSDVVFSNFGGLNCINSFELKVFLEKLSAIQSKGNKLILVIMPNKCFMEDVYHLLSFQFSKLGRRATKSGLSVMVEREEVKTYYHSPETLKKMLSDTYKLQLIKPVALFLPPSYLEGFFKRNGWAINILFFLEKLMGKFTFAASVADHYILVAEKK